MTQLNTAEGVALEVSSRVARISIAGGFETDIGLHVMRGRRKIPEDDELPCVQVLEADGRQESAAGRLTTIKVQQIFVIDGFSACDPDNPNDKAHAMIRDIKRVLFDGVRRTFDDTVVDVEFLGRDIGPRPDGSGAVQARVMIAVSYVEDLAKP